MFALTTQHLGDRFFDLRRVRTHYHIGTLFDRDRSFGIHPDGNAGHTQGGRLLLQTTAVSKSYSRIFPEMEEVHIGKRLGKIDMRAEVDPELFQVKTGARMNRKYQRQVL